MTYFTLAVLAAAAPGAATPALDAPAPASWEAAAEAWEATARRLREAGDHAGAEEALAAAASAWERAAAAAAARAEVPPASAAARIHALTAALRRTDEALARWRRAAVAWAESADRWRALGDEVRAADARRRAGVALSAIEALEARRATLERDLRDETRRRPGLPVSAEGREAVAERWAATARSWEETARSWDRAGDAVRAAAARARADEARARIRDAWPDVGEAWLARWTYPAPEAPAPPTPAVETAPEIPPLVSPPEAPRRPALPPAWRLSPREREALDRAEAHREAARRWEETARLRAAEGDTAGAEEARRERDRAIGRAIRLEESVRRAYADREAALAAEISRLLGETAPTADEILEALDRQAAPETPPEMVATLRPLEPPPLPPEALPDTSPERERRGIIDIAAGGPIPSTLTVNGRKVIDVGYTRTSFKEDLPNRPGGNTQTSLDIGQELQVRVFGRVGAPDRDHINVEVNFDDTRRGIQEVNSRTIKVDFDGSRHVIGGGVPGPGKANQYEINADFGDVSFALPGSRFAVYNKSLFGLRGDVSIYDLEAGPLSAQRLTFTGVASQTKGVSATKVFRTSGTRQILDIADVDFVRRTFYRLVLDPAQAPVRDVVLLLDDRIATNDQATISRTAIGYDGGGGFSHTGNFDVLIGGQDFIANLATGVVELKRAVASNAVLAAVFVDAQGNAVPDAAPKIIQIGSDTTAAARAFFRPYELRNRYLLGREQILRNDPDFVFEIRDLLGNAFDQASGRTYNNIFGFDEENNNVFDEQNLDYDFGLIVPKFLDGREDTAPFVSKVAGVAAALSNQALYREDDPDADDRRYVIHVEFVSAVPQDIFVIGADIIAGSDIITVDGRRVERNRDYVIEYEGGIITFINPGVLGPNSEIRVDYEFLPFGGRFERTLAGGRLEAQITDYLSFGTTGIFDLSAGVDEAPRLALGGVPDDNRVFDFDARLGVMPLLRSLWKRRTGETPTGGWWDRLRLDLSGEWARSSRDPNTFGLAVLEDFEAVDDVVGPSFSAFAWAFAAAPTSTTNLAALPAAGRGLPTFSEADEGHLAEGSLGPGQVQKALRIDLDFAAGETWIAIVQPLSAQALDFTRLTSIEAFLAGAETLGVFVDFGLVVEDADGDGVLDTEDRNRDGFLNPGEDIGWAFDHPNRGAIAVGPANGRLDSEDLDGNGALDFRDDLFRVGDLNTSPDVERQVLIGAGGRTWTSYKVSRPFTNPATAQTTDADSRVVKHVRLVFTRTPTGTPERFTVFADGLLFRRSRFGGAPASLSLLGRNDREDSLYVSLSDFNRDKRADGPEQALAIQYTLGAGETAAIEQRFARRVNLTDYSTLRYYVYGDGRGAIFTLRLVTDAANFVEIRRHVTFGQFPLVRDPSNWRAFDVDLLAVRDLIIRNILGGGLSEVVEGDIRVVGRPAQGQSPSLANINALALIVENPTGGVLTGEIWVNEITTRGVRRQEGDAQGVSFAGGWGSVLTLSGGLSSIDPTYRGIGVINNPVASSTVNRGQDDRNLSMALQIHELLPASWRLSLPLTASWRESKSTLDPLDVESALKSDLGTIATRSQTYGTTLRWWFLPAVQMAFGENRTDVDLRNEDRQTSHSSFNLSTGYSYSFPQRLFGLIPTGQSLNAGVTYAFSRSRFREENFATAFVDRFRDDRSQNASFSLSATPISPVSLRYGLSIATIDQRTHDPKERRDGMTSRDQNLSAQWNLRPRFGFAPSVSMSARYNESFFLTAVGAERKDVSTSGNFSVSLQVDPSVWSRYLSWLTIRYGYQITTAASYRGLHPSTAFSGVWGDFMEKRLFPWGQGSAVATGPEGVAAFRGSASNSVSHSWDGAIRTWPSLTWRYNASLTRSENFALSSFSLSEGFQGRMDWRLDLGEALARWWSPWQSSTLLWGVGFSRSDAVTSRSDNLTPNLSWSVQWHDRLLTTLNVTFSRSRSRTFVGAPRSTENEAWGPSLSFNYAFDLGIPEEIGIPGERRAIELQRRVQLNGGLGAQFSRAKDQILVSADNRTYNANLSLSYQVQRNLQLSAGATASLFEDDIVAASDRYTVGANSRLVWQF